MTLYTHLVADDFPAPVKNQTAKRLSKLMQLQKTYALNYYCTISYKS